MYLDESIPYKVADLSLAEWGRKEIEVSEHEMPGLMAVRRKYGPQKPLRDGIQPYCWELIVWSFRSPGISFSSSQEYFSKSAM